MEGLRKIAIAHYQGSPNYIKELAVNFFRAMDHDGDGKIDLNEFRAFMRGQGYHLMTDPRFFEKLDCDRNGTLDFWEVMTLYYILKGRVLFCNCCRDFIPGPYFTCLACLENPNFGNTFDLCIDCYLNRPSFHTHERVSHFIDNYSLLGSNISQTIMHKSLSSNANSQPSTSTSTASSDLQLNRPQHEKWEIAFKLLDAAMMAQLAIGGACTIL